MVRLCNITIAFFFVYVNTTPFLLLLYAIFSFFLSFSLLLYEATRLTATVEALLTPNPFVFVPTNDKLGVIRKFYLCDLKICCPKFKNDEFDYIVNSFS